MKIGKREITERIEVPYKQSIRILEEKANYMFFEILKTTA